MINETTKSNNDDKSIPLDPQQQQQQQQQEGSVSVAEHNSNRILTSNHSISSITNSNNNHSNANNNNNNNQNDNLNHSSISAQSLANKAEMMADEDPLLISQSLTYVTDDGGVLHSFHSAPFSIGFKFQFVLLELIFILLMVASVPIGAHGTVVGVCIANLILLAWFWYNLVRSVDVTADGTLRFWIGNIEVDVPFDKIINIQRVSSSLPCCTCCVCIPSQFTYRGFLATPSDGVAIVTTVPSTPFWLWPRSAGKPDRSCCFGMFACPRLTVVFSPAGGSLNFIREVENEMRNFGTITSSGKTGAPIPSSTSGHRGSAVPRSANQDYLDV